MVGGYQFQKKIIDNAVENAFKVIVFTEQNKLDLINEFNCKPDNIQILNLIPILPKKYEKIKHKDFSKIFSRFNFDKNKRWFFYPAQFWPHKNHIYLLHVMKELNRKKLNQIGFIFCGGDKGNLHYITKNIKNYKLDENIKVIGHINDEELISIYKYCDGLVIPTYLGRSSLPLLEGIYFNKKIFYSNNILDKSLTSYVDEFDLTEPKNLADKLVEFNITNTNTEYKYENLCSNNFFTNTYENIINEFRFSLNKWKNE